MQVKNRSIGRPVEEDLRSPREEHCIPQPILPWPLGVFSRRIKILPHAGWINMLIPLVPAPVHHFCQSWIVMVAFELGVGEAGRGSGVALLGEFGVGSEVGRGWC